VVGSLRDKLIAINCLIILFPTQVKASSTKSSTPSGFTWMRGEEDHQISIKKIETRLVTDGRLIKEGMIGALELTKKMFTTTCVGKRNKNEDQREKPTRATMVGEVCQKRDLGVRHM